MYKLIREWGEINVTAPDCRLPSKTRLRNSVVASFVLRVIPNCISQGHLLI